MVNEPIHHNCLSEWPKTFKEKPDHLDRSFVVFNHGLKENPIKLLALGRAKFRHALLPDTLNYDRDLARKFRHKCPSVVLFGTALSGVGEQEFRDDRW